MNDLSCIHCISGSSNHKSGIVFLECKLGRAITKGNARQQILKNPDRFPCGGWRGDLLGRLRRRLLHWDGVARSDLWRR